MSTTINIPIEYPDSLRAKIEEWLNWDKNPTTLNEIECLVKGNRQKELENRLFDRMNFGTAGLRAKMGAGYSMMNNLTIIQTAQGLLDYLLNQFANLKEAGVVVGYDARHNSEEFAKLTATIFLQENVPVYLFRQITPTPFVPYSVLRLKCNAGVMVTASHNPKDDNGYKVYLNNGAQIIPPHDKNIHESILKNLKPRETSWNINLLESHSLLKDPFDDIKKHYFEDVKSLCFHREANGTSDLKFTYTAMHGVGYEFSVEVFKAFNLKPFIVVEEQMRPDPEFPTVKFPNPEEGKSALNLSIDTANKNGSRFILANDPDADRLAVAEKLPDNTWKIFNGNEIGALLGWWLWFNYKSKNSQQNYRDVYMLYSTVSSNILKSIADVEGFSCEDTLTGFKWMGNRSDELIKSGKKVLFAFEEAIGFMCNPRVLDKDGISAEAVVAEMAVYLNDIEKRTLNDQIDWIYKRYGFHVSNNSYYLSYEPADIRRMFERIRHYDNTTGDNYTYPRALGPYKINKIRDLNAGLQIDFTKNGEISIPSFPISKSSEMMTFYFENKCVLTIRTSGTEPKIKWYSEIKADETSNKSRKEVKKELDDLITHMIDEFYQPKINNFMERTSS